MGEIKKRKGGGGGVFIYLGFFFIFFIVLSFSSQRFGYHRNAATPSPKTSAFFSAPHQSQSQNQGQGQRQSSRSGILLLLLLLLFQAIGDRDGAPPQCSTPQDESPLDAPWFHSWRGPRRLPHRACPWQRLLPSTAQRNHHQFRELPLFVASYLLFGGFRYWTSVVRSWSCDSWRLRQKRYSML